MKSPLIKISSILLIIFLAGLSHQQSTQISGNTTCDTSTTSALVQTGIFIFIQEHTHLPVSRTESQESILSKSSSTTQFPQQGSLSQFVRFCLFSATGRINGYSQAVGTDYSIRASRINQTNIVNFILLINQDISWASIQASFIFSSRSDLIVGSFYPDTQSLFVSGVDTLVAQYQLPNWTPVNGNVNFALLISSLRTADTFFNVNLTQANFISQTGLLSFQVYTDANPAL